MSKLTIGGRFDMKLENLKGLSSPILRILQEQLHKKMSSWQVDITWNKN